MSIAALVPYDAVILAGGTGSRLGGADKALLVLAGRSLLQRTVDAVDDARRVVLVGPRRDMPLPRDVTWVREDPPGGGPAAAASAGVTQCTAEIVVLLAVDTPLVDRRVVSDLVATLAADAIGDAAMLVDDAGRRQPLIAAYRRTALTAASPRISLTPPARSMRDLLRGLSVTEVADGTGVSRDADTWPDVTFLEAHLG